ncbi:MAG: hypothetical protein H7X97_13090 [Opitutaceae bacterium]|nr:hypothetical protein [Verrucomicrobiales bacterium]
MHAILRPLAVTFFALPLIANATTFKGSWKNRTNDTSGSVRIVVDVDFNNVSGSIDLDGAFLGDDDPAVINFEGSYNSEGKARFTVSGTDFGTVRGHFDSDGSFSMNCSNVNHGNITDIKVEGQFDLSEKTFFASYKFFNGDELTDKGVINAHVPKRPEIDVIRKTIDGNKAIVVVDVDSNSRIVKFQAVASGGAFATIVEEKPYKIKVTGLTDFTTLTITAKNADGLKTVETINVHAQSTSPMLHMLNAE